MWITVIVVYLVSGVGLSRQNLRILNTIKMIEMAVPGPVIVMWDFNLIITEMVEGGVVDDRMMPVFDFTFPTTISGAHRRCIDHILVPPGLRKELVTSNRILHQWRPHLGLHVVIKKASRESRRPEFRTPLRLTFWPRMQEAYVLNWMNRDVMKQMQ